MSEFIINKVTAFAEKLLPSMGLELVEVQFRREQQGWVLRLYMDIDGGITHEHCRMVSRELGDFLDVEELIEHAYQLEISSPGLERSLRNIKDFERFVGRKAKIKLHQAINGQKVFVGEILQVAGEMIELEIDDGTNIQIFFEKISKARLAL